MKANINYMIVVEYEGRYHIMTEFSRLPVETFGSRKHAQDFVDGYVKGYNSNNYNRRGLMFRKFVEHDIRVGIDYVKVLELTQQSA